MKNGFSLLPVLALFFLSLAPLSAAPSKQSLTGTILTLKGKASLVSPGGSTRALKKGDSFTEGDQLILETKRSNVTVRASDGTQYRFIGKTKVSFKDFRRSQAGVRTTRITLLWGKVLAKVAKLTSKKSRFEIKAGGVVCGVRGSTPGASYDNETNTGTFYNYEGDVYGSDGNKEFDIPEGYSTTFQGDDFGDLGQMGQDDMSQFSDFISDTKEEPREQSQAPVENNPEASNTTYEQGSGNGGAENNPEASFVNYEEYFEDFIEGIYGDDFINVENGDVETLDSLGVDFFFPEGPPALTGSVS